MDMDFKKFKYSGDYELYILNKKMEILSNKEKKMVKKFAKNGYYIFDIKNKKILEKIKNNILKESSIILKKKLVKSKFFDYSHKYVKINNLNSFRLKIYNKLNKDKNFLKDYYLMGREYIDLFCGNELAVQKNKFKYSTSDNSSLLQSIRMFGLKLSF